MSRRLEDIQKRHAAIKSLVASRSIPNQKELARALRTLHISATQATLSRDLAELGIARVPHEEGNRYELRPTGGEDALKLHVAEEIISVNANESVVVVKTFPGRAQGVAVMLDNQEDQGILGTIAGDDTVLVVPRSVKQIRKIVHHVKQYIGLR